MVQTREEREAVESRSAFLLEIIGPGLIMLMVGSLVFFLIEVFYRGPHNARLCWVFGLFTFASVLVSRISITEGKDRGLIYGSALGLAAFITSTVLIEFSGNLGIILEPVILLLFIIVVMWSSSKLTWDCTVIDSSKDNSAVGITELVSRQFNDDDDQPEDETSSDAQAGNMLLALFNRKRRKNTPGIWVFYFAMAAIPVFGLGQFFVSPSQSGSAGWVILLFGVYLASALALLMTTSLLGLQRYLRKRNTHMPMEIERSWLAAGCGVALAVLVLVLLVPRPNFETGLSSSLQWLTSPKRKSSDQALGSDGQEEKKSGNSAKSSEEGESSSGQAKTENTSGESDEGEKSTSGGKQQGEQSSNSSSKDQKNQSQKQGEQNKNQNNQNNDSESSQQQQQRTAQEQARKNKQDRQRPDKSAQSAVERAEQQRREQEAEEQNKKQENEEEESQNSSNNSNENSRNQQQNGQSGQPNSSFNTPEISQAVTFAKTLIYIIAIALAIVGAVLMRKEIVALFRSLMDALRQLFGGKKKTKKRKTADEPSEAKPQKPLPPFASFTNPFSSGRIDSMPTDQVIEYTFHALEAWARDNGFKRKDDQTPHEFVRKIVKLDPSVGQAAGELANLYGKMMFAQSEVAKDDILPLKHLWELMQNNAIVDRDQQLAVAAT